MPNYLIGISEYTTKELVRELLKRKGVEVMTVAPHSICTVKIDKDWEGKKEVAEFDGSATVLVVAD